MFKKIIISILIFLAFLYSLIPNPYTLVHAARPTEVTYPEIPGAIRPVTIKTALPEYIRYAFNFFVVISGLVCFATLIYGGITYLTSAGNPGRQKDATSQIAAAFLGIFIIFSAYLISKTINPQLIIPHISIEGVGGLILFSGTTCDEYEPGGETRVIMRDTPRFGEKEDGEPFSPGSLKFYSRPGELKVVFYTEEDYEGTPWGWISSDFQDCLPLTGALVVKSIKLFWQLPGIYLCTDTYEKDVAGEWACKGDEKYLPADTALLEGPFNDNVKSIRIRNATVYMGPLPPGETIEWLRKRCEEDFGGFELIPAGTEAGGPAYACVTTRYGVVLHEHADFSGMCEVFTETIPNLETDANPLTGKPPLIKTKTSSATVFLQARSATGTGEGVRLCEHVNPKRGDPECHGPFDEETIVEDVDAAGVDIPNDEISSIIIDGSYLAVLFDGGESDAFKGTCEVFTRSDSNFRDNPIGRKNCIMGNWGCSDCLSSFIILPTGKGGAAGSPLPPPACTDECSPAGKEICAKNDQCEIPVAPEHPNRCCSCEDRDGDGCLEWGVAKLCPGCTIDPATKKCNCP